MSASPAPRLAAELDRHWKRYEWECRRLEREGPSEPAVHDCRVAGRRLMTLLRLVERVAPGSGARGLRRRVRRTFRALARLRDVQVEQALAMERAGQQPVLGGLVRRLHREEARLRRAAGDAVSPRDRRDQARRFTALQRHWEQPREAEGRAALPRALHRELRRELRAHAAAVAGRNAAVAAGDPDSLHLVRVALKKFRYLLEAARRLDGDTHAGPLARAKRWQARLGHLQDLRVLMDDARAQAKAHPDPTWDAALAALEAELASGTRAYLMVRHRLTALVAPYGAPTRRRGAPGGGSRSPAARPPHLTPA